MPRDAGETFQVQDSLSRYAVVAPLANGGVRHIEGTGDFSGGATCFEKFSKGHTRMVAMLPSECKPRFRIFSAFWLKIGRMEDSLTVALGARLKKARQRAKLTQKQVGVALEFEGEHSAVGQWERGKELPSLVNLIRAAEIYPASLDELVWGMGNSLDARIKKLPAVVREPLLDRIMKDIQTAEELIRRLPQLSGPVILDDDAKLRKWSALIKQEAQSKTKKQTRGGGKAGTQ